jgi:hypothetical protein
MLGWVWDAQQESVRPILGIAGSSVLGKAVEVGFAVRHAAVTGRQEYVVAVGGEERKLYRIDLREVEASVQELAAPTGGDRVTMSPSGKAAVLFYTEPQAQLVVVRDLDTAEPVVGEVLDLSVEGKPDRIAVSDDGSVVAAGYRESKKVLLVEASGNRYELPVETVVQSLSFVDGKNDLLFTAEDGVYRVGEVSASAEVRRISEMGTATGVVLIDETRALVVNGETASIEEMQLETGETRSVECPCTPTGLTRMGTGLLYRLNEYEKSPLWLVEIRESGLRMVFVPPDPADLEQPEE